VGYRREHVFVLTNYAVNQVINIRIIMPTFSEKMIVVHRRRINECIVFSFLQVV
jgi:hypothetical protein